VSLRVLDMGTTPYGDAWALQKDLVAQRQEGSVPDTLLLLEHEPVITLGRKTTPENFKPQDIPVFQVERGGDATVHAPGQLVGYPIIKLTEPDVHKFVRQLEEVLIRTVSDFGIAAGRKEGHTGVWSGEKKLASIGVAVVNWVTFHGFALNVNTDMRYFHLIKPCGLDPDTITSMEQVLGHEVPIQEVKRVVVQKFSEVFGRTPEVATPPRIPSPETKIK
jgi:lipoate-protein ligase B